MEEGKYITIMAVPEDGGAVLRLRIRKWGRNAIFTILAAAGLGILAVVGFAIFAATRVPVWLEMRERAAGQQESLARYRHDVEMLGHEVEALDTFNHKMHVILDQNPAPEAGDPPASSNRVNATALPADTDAYSLTLLFERVQKRIGDLMNVSSGLEAQLSGLQAAMQDEASLLQSTPSVWPTHGWLASGFGSRSSPFTGSTQAHYGLDIATRMGAPVVAPADGTVMLAARSGDFGNLIIIDHGYRVMTYFGHLSRIETREGERVRRGDLIGEVGSTGRSTGPHLHYEVRVGGVPVNPIRYVLLE